MDIGMILDNEFTGDMRVENEVIKLREAGHDVTVICFNHSNKKPYENFHGAKIIRINLPLNWKNKMRALTNTRIDIYTLYWSRLIVKYTKLHSFDVLHIHDLYLLGSAFKAKAKLKRPLKIVADLHENYPAALKNYKFANIFPGKYIISIPKWRETEIKWIQKADKVITVIEEAVDRYTKLGIKEDKITVVANYVNRSEFVENAELVVAERKKESTFSAVYVGGFNLHRGLESVVRALPLIRKEIPYFKLILVGKGRNMPDLKSLAKSLSVQDMVSFEGWQSPKSIPQYIINSQVGLIPHLKNEHTDHTIPHKLFQYMLLERPVLASNCKPLERILNESHSGLVFESNNEKDFAKQIIKLIQNDDLRRKMGDNGRKAVLEKYNWEQASKNLIELYNSLEN